MLFLSSQTPYLTRGSVSLEKLIAWDSRGPPVTQQPMSPARWTDIAVNTVMQREELPQEGSWDRNLLGAEQLSLAVLGVLSASC